MDIYDEDGGVRYTAIQTISASNGIGNVRGLSSRQGNIYITVVSSALISWHSDADRTERMATFSAAGNRIVFTNTASILSAGGATFRIALSASAVSQMGSGFKFVVNYHGSSSSSAGTATALMRISGTKSTSYREVVLFGNTTNATNSSFYTFKSITAIDSGGTTNWAPLRTTSAGGTAAQFAIAGVDSGIGTFSHGRVTFQFADRAIATGRATFEIDDGMALTIIQSAYKTSQQVEYTIGTLDAQTGDFNFGSFKLSYGSTFSAGTAKFDIDHTTGMAHSGTQLREVDRFYNADGVFVLGDHGKTIAIYNGQGDRAEVFTDPGDTLKTVTEKIQKAITEDLAMTSGNAEVDKNLVSFVESATSGGDAAVESTIVVRSPWQGTNGMLYFAGPEDVVNALSIATIQDPSDLDQTLGQMKVSVYNAHTGVDLGMGTTTDGILRNVISGVEVGLDPNIDIQASWNSLTGKIEFASEAGEAERFLHIVDNSMDLHIGANEGQVSEVYIGQVDGEALRIQGLQVSDQKLAEQAISILDGAINRVSSERARMGAYMNRLEYALNNLATQEENITQSESTIRDLNVAKEISKMTELQMLAQLDTSMIAQANQLPQMVMSLLK